MVRHYMSVLSRFILHLLLKTFNAARVYSSTDDYYDRAHKSVSDNS